MSVFRIERNKNYTVMSNYHLARHDDLAEVQGPSVHDAVPAG